MRPSKTLTGHDFLTSRAWRIVRARHLRQHPNCRWCGARGPKGNTVDHIEPRSRRPDLALVASNLQTLCSRCHGQAKQHHERTAGDVMAGGSSSAGWPVDPGHPWNLAGNAAPAARLMPSRPAPAQPPAPARTMPYGQKRGSGNASRVFLTNLKAERTPK